MTKIWYAVVAVVVVAGALVLFVPESAPNGNPETILPSDSEAAGTVRITAEGFVPAAITVKKGESVTWVNEAGRDSWPASAMHPTHTAYPGSDIQKCGTAEAATMFDACGGIVTGDSWTFVFNEVGTWKYHDHLRATVYGSVTVE